MKYILFLVVLSQLFFTGCGGKKARVLEPVLTDINHTKQTKEHHVILAEPEYRIWCVGKHKALVEIDKMPEDVDGIRMYRSVIDGDGSETLVEDNITTIGKYMDDNNSHGLQPTYNIYKYTLKSYKDINGTVYESHGVTKAADNDITLPTEANSSTPAPSVGILAEPEYRIWCVGKHKALVEIDKMPEGADGVRMYRSIIGVAGSETLVKDNITATGKYVDDNNSHGLQPKYNIYEYTLKSYRDVNGTIEESSGVTKPADNDL